MKTKEELNAIKEEVEKIEEKLKGLTDDELMEVSGGLSDNMTGIMPIIFATMGHTLGNKLTGSVSDVNREGCFGTEAVNEATGEKQ